MSRPIFLFPFFVFFFFFFFDDVTQGRECIHTFVDASSKFPQHSISPPTYRRIIARAVVIPLNIPAAPFSDARRFKFSRVDRARYARSIRAASLE